MLCNVWTWLYTEALVCKYTRGPITTHGLLETYLPRGPSYRITSTSPALIYWWNKTYKLTVLFSEEYPALKWAWKQDWTPNRWHSFLNSQTHLQVIKFEKKNQSQDGVRISHLNWHKFVRFHCSVFSLVIVKKIHLTLMTSDTVLPNYQAPQSSTKILQCTLYYLTRSLVPCSRDSTGTDRQRRHGIIQVNFEVLYFKFNTWYSALNQGRHKKEFLVEHDTGLWVSRLAVVAWLVYKASCLLLISTRLEQEDYLSHQ